MIIFPEKVQWRSIFEFNNFHMCTSGWLNINLICAGYKNMCNILCLKNKIRFVNARHKKYLCAYLKPYWLLKLSLFKTFIKQVAC